MAKKPVEQPDLDEREEEILDRVWEQFSEDGEE